MCFTWKLSPISEIFFFSFSLYSHSFWRFSCGGSWAPLPKGNLCECRKSAFCSSMARPKSTLVWHKRMSYLLVMTLPNPYSVALSLLKYQSIRSTNKYTQSILGGGAVTVGMICITLWHRMAKEMRTHGVYGSDPGSFALEMCSLQRVTRYLYFLVL